MAGQPKVIKMDTQEQEILEKAAEIQAKREEEYRKEETLALLELNDKFGLTLEMLNEAKDLEQKLSDPKSGILSLASAITFYKEANLTVEQVMFLAINSNSKVNLLSNRLREQDVMLNGVRSKLSTLEVGMEELRKARINASAPEDELPFPEE